MPDVTPQSRALRRDLRDRRAALPPAHRVAAAQSLAANILALPFHPLTGHVAGYWALDGEIALHAWQLGLARELIYCLPVLHDDARLRFAPWSSGDALRTNRFGIPEPDVDDTALIEATQLALAVVPLTGFDDACHRIGMGGGWYDRTFDFRREPDTLAPRLVGAAFDVQRLPAIEPHPWDVRLDAVCTESSTYIAGPTA